MTFFDREGPRRLGRVLDLAASVVFGVLWICCLVTCMLYVVARMLCVVVCRGIFGEWTSILSYL